MFFAVDCVLLLLLAVCVVDLHQGEGGACDRSIIHQDLDPVSCVIICLNIVHAKLIFLFAKSEHE
jgi:hypothetical protein